MFKNSDILSRKKDQTSIMIKKLYLLIREVKHQLFQSLFGFSSACHHKPSCSQYLTEKIKEKGLILGGVKGLKRIFTCFAFNN